MMNELNQVLLFLHFLGLAMGFSASFGNAAMGGLIEKAAPAEKPVLARFPPVIARIGRYGLALLWSSGLILVYTKWGGMGSLPWQFHAKLALVVLLTATVEYIHALMRRGQKGDTSVAPTITMFGKAAMALALLTVVFAVLTFD